MEDRAECKGVTMSENIIEEFRDKIVLLSPSLNEMLSAPDVNESIWLIDM